MENVFIASCQGDKSYDRLFEELDLPEEKLKDIDRG